MPQSTPYKTKWSNFVTLLTDIAYGGLFAKSARGSVTPGFVNNAGVNCCNEGF